MHEAPKLPTVNDAMMEISVIEGRIMQTGAVDVEISMLSQIRSELMEQKVSPVEAIKKARGIEAGRQDYH